MNIAELQVGAYFGAFGRWSRPTTSKDHDASHGDGVVNDRDSGCQVEVVVVGEIVLQANVAVLLGRHVQTRQTDVQTMSTCTICINTL